MPALDKPSRARPTHLLYLHGFRSSPLSFKAQRTRDWLQSHAPEVHFWCPQLPPSPRDALALVARGIAQWPAHTSGVLGSSLGGFYATVVAEMPAHRSWTCVVMNPAVHPARDLAGYVGNQTAFHNTAEQFEFRAEFIDELRAMAPAAITDPRRYVALIAKGDELLDWREMADFFAGAHLRLLEGSDHALSDFDDHLPHLLRFLQLCD
jgi:uncharacterized protein